MSKISHINKTVPAEVKAEEVEEVSEAFSETIKTYNAYRNRTPAEVKADEDEEAEREREYRSWDTTRGDDAQNDESYNDENRFYDFIIHRVILKGNEEFYKQQDALHERVMNDHKLVSDKLKLEKENRKLEKEKLKLEKEKLKLERETIVV